MMLKHSIVDHLPLQGAEKTIISKMLVGGSDKRTYAIDRHAGVVRLHCTLPDADCARAQPLNFMK